MDTKIKRHMEILKLLSYDAREDVLESLTRIDTKVAELTELAAVYAAIGRSFRIWATQLENDGELDED